MEVINFSDEHFRSTLVDLVNRHERFIRHTRWFDGSLLLATENSNCWLKVYRSKVIDCLDHMPILGYTFKVSGKTPAWTSLISGHRKWADLITPGTRHFASPQELAEAHAFRAPEIRIEGNVLESQRIVQAVSAIAECIIIAIGRAP